MKSFIVSFVLLAAFLSSPLFGDDFFVPGIPVPSGTQSVQVNSVSLGTLGFTADGTFTDASGVEHCFRYEFINNVKTFFLPYDPVTSPTTGETILSASSTTAVGNYIDASSVSHSFEAVFGSTDQGDIVRPGSSQSAFTTAETPPTVTCTAVNPPGNLNGTYVEAIDGTNVVGFFANFSDLGVIPAQTAFLYDGTNYTDIEPPLGVNGSEAYGISGDTIVGIYFDASNIQHGFLYSISTGHYTTLPGALGNASGNINLAITGVSGSNVVGNTYDSTNNVFDAFLYNGTTTIPIVYPNSVSNFINAVSGNNVVGYYEDSSGNSHGFTYDANAATYASVDVPGGSNTVVNCVSGTLIGGTYTASDGSTQGFVAAPDVAPAFVTATTCTFVAAEAGSFSVGATSFPFPTYSATGLPGWATLDPNTGIISGTPANAVGSPFTVQLTATNGVSPDATQTLTLIVNPGETSPQTYSEWVAQFTDLTDTAASDTPEHDGISTGFKYLADINPEQSMTAADRAALPVLTTPIVSGTQYLRLTYRQYASLDPNVTVIFQTSSDLKTWVNDTTDLPVQIGTDANTGDPIFQFQVAVAGSTALFLRLGLVIP